MLAISTPYYTVMTGCLHGGKAIDEASTACLSWASTLVYLKCYENDYTKEWGRGRWMAEMRIDENEQRQVCNPLSLSLHTQTKIVWRLTRDSQEWNKFH